MTDESDTLTDCLYTAFSWFSWLHGYAAQDGGSLMKSKGGPLETGQNGARTHPECFKQLRPMWLSHGSSENITELFQLLSERSIFW